MVASYFFSTSTTNVYLYLSIPLIFLVQSIFGPSNFFYLYYLILQSQNFFLFFVMPIQFFFYSINFFLSTLVFPDHLPLPVYVTRFLFVFPDLSQFLSIFDFFLFLSISDFCFLTFFCFCFLILLNIIIVYISDFFYSINFPISRYIFKYVSKLCGSRKSHNNLHRKKTVRI